MAISLVKKSERKNTLFSPNRKPYLHNSNTPDQSRTEANTIRRFPRTDPRKYFTWREVCQFDPSAFKPLRWIVDSFLAEGTIQLLYGARGSFKSTLLLFAARAVATGEEFLGMKTRRRRVLYLDYENPANVIKGRNHDFELNLSENLKIWDRFSGGPVPRPEDPRLAAIIEDCIKETGHAPWLIFDSWSSFVKDGEGGETTGQIAPNYAHIRKLADLRAAVTVIDHTRKDDPHTLYGGEDKEAKVDSIHKLLKPKDKTTLQNPIIQVKTWLKRTAPDHEGDFAFKVQSRQDAKGNWHIDALLPVHDIVEGQNEHKIEVLRRLIKENPTLGQEAIAKLASKQRVPRWRAVELLKAGEGKHWIVVIGSQHNKFRYRLI
jgi:AAA domain